MNLENKIKINVVPSSFWQAEYFAPRPTCEKLNTNKLNNAGLNVMRHWKDCLKDYVKNNPRYFNIGEN